MQGAGCVPQNYEGRFLALNIHPVAEN
jgi:hypothetical protein